jgi:hypothetical protein
MRERDDEDYEAKRRANIAKNMEILAQLGLSNPEVILLLK